MNERFTTADNLSATYKGWHLYKGVPCEAHCHGVRLRARTTEELKQIIDTRKSLTINNQTEK